MRKISIYFTYYFKRIFQLVTYSDFTIPYRNRSKGFVSYPPGSILEFALEKEKADDLKLILSELKEGDTFFDIGANFGLYSLSVHDKFLSTVDIHCFEPEIEAFRRLIQNRRINNANWKCHNFGMGENEGWLNITSEFGGYNHITNDSKKSQKIRVLTIDQYIQATGVEEVSLVKVDVEGFEWFVLKGASESLGSKKIKKIIFEVDDHQQRYGVKESQYTDLLENFGYKRDSISNVNFQLWRI